MPAIQVMSGPGQAEAAAVKTDLRTQKVQGMQSAFSSYMKQSSFQGAQMAKQQTAGTIQPSKAQSGGSVSQDYARYQSDAAAKAGKISSADDGTANTGKAVSGEVSEAVSETAEAVRDIIKEELGVSDEQLDEAMMLLGLSPADLLNPQQLCTLAMELTGSQDAGMMLFSEGFQNMMQQVSAVTQDLLQNLGMTMEQLMDQVNQIVSSVETETSDVNLTPDMAPETVVAEADTAGTQIQPEAAETEQISGTAQQVQTQQVQENAQQTGTQTQQVQEQVQPQEAGAGLTQDETQPQEAEAQPEEADSVQGSGQAEGGQQTGEEESSLSDGAGTRGNPMGQEQNPAFEFHAEARQAQPSDAPVANTAANQAPAPQVNVENIIRQIAEYTRVHLTENVKTIEMELNPASLGKVFLHVTEKAGTITAQLTAQDENVKEALVQQAAILKDNLNQQGIRVTAVEVTTGTHEFESNLEKDARQQEEQAGQREEQSGRRSRRSINLNELDDLDGLSGLMSEEEMLAAQIMKDNGNNVDYKA